MAKLRVLHVSMECVPYSKVGGMADVVGSLPAALRDVGWYAAVMTPYYPRLFKLPGKRRVKELASFDVEVGGTAHPVRLLAVDKHTVLVDQPTAYDRDGVYADPATGVGYSDSLFQCLVLQQAARVALRDGVLKADIVHCHDNHTGMLPAFLRDDNGPRSVFTIHNLAYQGRYSAESFVNTGLDPERFQHSAFEFHGDFSLMKAGLEMSDLVTTVSPGYAAEVLQPDEGEGMDGVLRARGERFIGIINGIDTEIWDPATDPLLPANYSLDDFDGKATCKRALQERSELDIDAGAPLLGIVTRVTQQKGLDLLGPLLPWIVQRGAQLVMLGTGDPAIVDMFRGAAERWPTRIALLERYDEEAAHGIYGGSDILCMPSRFEPCGLSQMYAMRYGSVPVVT
ncbi:MAG: glycogen synthase, partial [Planctomycetota bacterium]